MTAALIAVMLLAAPSEDVAWIAKLPNVKLEGDLYVVKGDADAVIEKLTDGLSHHGWVSTRVDVASVKAIRATKGGEKLFILFGPKGFSVEKKKLEPGEQPNTVESIGVFENEITRSVVCDGKSVAVRGNHSHITLIGKCQQLSVTGDENLIMVQGDVASVLFTGNENVVTVPAKAKPNVGDTGQRNQVKH